MILLRRRGAPRQGPAGVPRAPHRVRSVSLLSHSSEQFGQLLVPVHYPHCFPHRDVHLEPLQHGRGEGAEQRLGPPGRRHAPAPVQPRRQRVHSLGRGAGGGRQVRGAVSRAAGAGEVASPACVDITALDIYRYYICPPTRAALHRRAALRAQHAPQVPQRGGAQHVRGAPVLRARRACALELVEPEYAKLVGATYV